MGYGLMVYSVDIDKLTDLYGSGDDKIRKIICGRFQNDIADCNDQLGYSNEKGQESIFEAIRHLIMGNEKTLSSTLYGYGLEFMVRHFGKFLDNSLFYPCSFKYLTDEISSHLSVAGTTVEMDDLLYYNAPFELPTPDEFPMYGHWKASSVAQSVEALQRYPGKSPEIEAIFDWLKTASSNKEGIIGYYY